MKKESKKIKEKAYKSEDQKELVRFVSILLLVVIVMIGVYFVTKIFVKQDNKQLNKETNVTEIDYSKMVFGTMLNKDGEYYAVAYSSKDNNANYYGSIINKYLTKENSLNVYYIDLEDSMNKSFVVEGETDLDVNNISELKVGKLTLFKIEDGKIVSAFENIDIIKEELGK